MPHKKPFSNPACKAALQTLGSRIAKVTRHELADDSLIYVHLAYNKDGQLMGCGYDIADTPTDDTVVGKEQNAPTSLRTQ